MDCPQCGFGQPDSNECVQCQSPMGDMADQANILFDSEPEAELPAPEPPPTATAVAPPPRELKPPLEAPPAAPPKPAAPPPPEFDDLPTSSSDFSTPAETGVTSKPPPAEPKPPPVAATPKAPPPAAPKPPPAKPAASGPAPSVVLVTTSDVPGKQIGSVQGMVSAHALVQMEAEVLAQLAANPALPLSGAAMDQATKTAEIGLIGAAVAKGSNAVVGITSDWKPAADGALLLTLSGTAVSVA